MLYNFQRETTADRTRDFDTVDQRALHPKCSPSLSPAFSTLAERRLEYSYIRDIFLLANGPSDIRLLGSRNFPSREIRRRSTADFLSADGEKRSLSKRRARSPKTQPLRAARAAPFPPPDHRSLSGFSSTFTIRDAILLRSPHSSTCATYTVRGKSGGNGSAPDLKNIPLPPWSGFVAGCRRGWRARGTPANPSQKITVPPRGARKSCATSVRERSLLRGISSLFLRSLRRWPQGRPRSSFQCG